MEPLPLSEVATWVFCPQCKVSMKFRANVFARYFRDLPITHSRCGKDVDWWDVVRASIRENRHPLETFAPMGAQPSAFDVSLRPRQFTEVRFSEYGFSPGAKILHVSYNVDGTLTPLEHVGNASFGTAPRRHLIPPVIYLYGAEFGDGPFAETRVTVVVTWISREENEEAAQALIDAFEAFTLKRYESFVIPANVAVESKLARLLIQFLESKGIAKNRVKSFLSDGATYSHQLNVVLPVLLSFTAAPPLPSHIRGAL